MAVIMRLPHNYTLLLAVLQILQKCHFLQGMFEEQHVEQTLQPYTMAQPYVGEIRMFGGNFAPAGWLFCEGQLLPISENETLFQLIGTTFGGDGESTFALPDLRGRLPMHQGNGFILAETGGVEQITLSTSQIPNHTHIPQANSGIATSTDPANNFWAAQPALLHYASAGTANINLAGNTLASAGGNQPHENRQPYLCISFIISLFGIFPTPT